VTDVVRDARPHPQVTVAFAPVKGDRPEWAVQKLTEIGVDRIVPLVAARSVVRWTAGGGQVDRWRRVAREAAMQSRRTWLPVVDDVTGLASLLVDEPGAALAHPGGRPPSLDRPLVLVGPEGGWDEAELAAAASDDSGTSLVGLGPHVLRTETAAVVAGALLCALRAGTVGQAV
jgi:16S rRNA (uracil1498-N3)-methyltransferase